MMLLHPFMLMSYPKPLDGLPWRPHAHSQLGVLIRTSQALHDLVLLFLIQVAIEGAVDRDIAGVDIKDMTQS